MAGAANAAQSSVSSADIQRLQDAVYDTSGEITRLRTRDSELASRLQTELDDLRDEVTYLKVKMRKEGSVARTEYSALRDRIQDVRRRAVSGSSGRTTTPTEVTGGSASANGPYDVPVGTEMDVRLQTPLDSGTAQIEDRFEATTLVDLTKNGRVLVPAGSTVRGLVTGVHKAGRLERKGSLTVTFDRITVRGRSYPMRATVTEALESEGLKGEIGKIGAGAGVGAVLGGILGGLKGAIAGILIGAGGTIAATEGEDVELDAGTVLRIRLDSMLTLQEFSQ
jgi:hypothetical protein